MGTVLKKKKDNRQTRAYGLCRPNSWTAYLQVSYLMNIFATYCSDEVLPIQGGFLTLGRIVCPFILRSNVALLPMQVVKVAAVGTTTHGLLKDCLSDLKGWLASPRELAFLTEKCQKHSLPLVFGRDTRLVPLPQMRTLFKGKPGFENLTFPEKDDASDQHRVSIVFFSFFDNPHFTLFCFIFVWHKLICYHYNISRRIMKTSFAQVLCHLLFPDECLI